MKITLHGAAGEVTGSAYLVETDRARVLVDFGMFHGSHSGEKNCVPAGLSPEKLNAVLVTHAHLDHTGRLPLLIKADFRGPIYATDATRELTSL
ncbi:MAG TPA: MBL fold metallo-hydrolase, partial [Verrucomicrobiae bacterium]|nr:MBL fold metallo-hydrolase [Verrucomicrobiae bacterium]